MSIVVSGWKDVIGALRQEEPLICMLFHSLP